MFEKKTFVLYDGRAWTDPTTASTYTCASSELEAIEDSMDAEENGWGDGIWFEYDDQDMDGATLLVNELIRPDIMEKAKTMKNE